MEYKGNPEGIFPEEWRSFWGYFRICERCKLLQGYEHGPYGFMKYSEEQLQSISSKHWHEIEWEGNNGTK